MTADTYDPFLGLILQGTGNNNNNWGAIANNSMVSPAARAIAGIVNRSNTGGTLDLSGSPPPAAMRQDIDAIQNFNGALTSDQTVIVPNLSKVWLFANNTTGAFNLFVKTAAGTATQIPQGTTKQVYCDGNNGVFRTDKEEIGSFRISGKASAGPGELACNGASLLKAEFPDLYAAIGTTWGSADSLHFTLPNVTDTGRFLRSSSGSLTVGTYQSNQNAAHTHTVTGAPDAGTLATASNGAHQHNVFLHDPGHTHVIPYGMSGVGSTDTSAPQGGPNYLVLTVNDPSTSSATTGITIGSVNGVANDNLTASNGAHTHNITGAPGIGTLGTASQGGTEARPEAAVVLVCIRY